MLNLKLRKLQNQNVFLNRLANEYEILPEGANLSVEIVREFLTAGHFLRTRCQAAGHVILTRQKVKSPKKYNTESKLTLKKNTSLHGLHCLQFAVCVLT